MSEFKLYDLTESAKPVFAPVLIAQTEDAKRALLDKIQTLDSKHILVTSFIKGMSAAYDTQSPFSSTSLEWSKLPYLGAGLLREQLQRLYWTTIAGLTPEKAPIKLPNLPQCLRPNLEIVTLDGSVKCHDWVLAARWRFVRNMFLFAGEETETRRVSLEDVGITTAALHYILYFMYTDRVDLLDNQSLCLSILKWCHELYLADFDDKPFPGAERLIKHCTKPFAQPITIENSIPIYRASIEGGSEEHEQRALAFIARRLKDMMESDRRCAELRTLNPEVLASICLRTLERVSNLKRIRRVWNSRELNLGR